MEAACQPDVGISTFVHFSWKICRGIGHAVGIGLEFAICLIEYCTLVICVPWLFASQGVVIDDTTSALLMLGVLALATLVGGAYFHLCILDRSWWRSGLLAGVLTIYLLVSSNAVGTRLLVDCLPLMILPGAWMGTILVERWPSAYWQNFREKSLLLRIVARVARFIVLTLFVFTPIVCLKVSAYVMSDMAKREFESQPVPDVIFERADGIAWRLADHREGKVVVIDFWATWCGPCRAAMPEMRALYEQYADRTDFMLIGIAEESDREKVANYCDEIDLSWQQLFLPTEPLTEGVHPNALTRAGIPSVWIIDREGIIVGVDLRGEAVRATIERLMDR